MKKTALKIEPIGSRFQENDKWLRQNIPSVLFCVGTVNHVFELYKNLCLSKEKEKTDFEGRLASLKDRLKTLEAERFKSLLIRPNDRVAAISANFFKLTRSASNIGNM
ncbi:MAG: hypothetical protein WBB23_05570 [Desulforhopalus sp.]